MVDIAAEPRTWPQAGQRGDDDAGPDPILAVVTAYMGTRYLVVGCELGLFEALAAGPLVLADLASAAGLPVRTTRILADALVALGLLVGEGGRYANSGAAQHHLTGRDPVDLRPYLHLTGRKHPSWVPFTDAIRSGRAPGFIDRLDEESQRAFSQGVEAITSPAAQALAARYRFEKHTSLLDLGGGTGSFLRAIRARYPRLRCGLFELPPVAALARARMRDDVDSGLVRVFEGDLLNDRLPEGYDALLLADVVHLLSVEENLMLLRRIRDSVDAGSRLLLVDFWTDPTHTRPVLAALMAGEFLLAGGDGDVYSSDEAREMLTRAGWRTVEECPLAGPAGLIVAEGA